MASSSLTILTKYTSGTTIVTADAANAWYGGLYGSFEAQSLSADDPRVVGHQHDGQFYDGHASKIDLINHVTGQLLNQNLGTDSVTKRTVSSFLNQSLAIPEYEIVDGNTYYYLDLSAVYTYIDDSITATPFESADTGGTAALDTVRQKSVDYSTAGLDFVYGSAKLDDMASGTNGDSRFLFDISAAAFRAGAADADQWDSANRGGFSAAFGKNNTVVAIAGFAAGDGHTIPVGSDDTAAFGKNNVGGSKTSLLSGEEAQSYIDGEVVHASGKMFQKGDAQSSEFTVRGVMSMTPGVGVTLTADGASKNYAMEVGSNYAITATIIGKAIAPSVESGVYKLEAMGIGTSGTVSSPVVTYIARTAYFTAGAPNIGVTLVAGAGNTFLIHIADASIVITQTAWCATITLTKVHF